MNFTVNDWTVCLFSMHLQKPSLAFKHPIISAHGMQLSPCPAASEGHKSPQFVNRVQKLDKYVENLGWHPDPFQHRVRMRMGQWNHPTEEGRKELHSLWWLCTASWSPRPGRQSIIFIILWLRDLAWIWICSTFENAFVNAGVKQIYEAEMACSSPPPWNFLNVSLHRGCAFVYNYFFSCILILVSFSRMHCNYIFSPWARRDLSLSHNGPALSKRGRKSLCLQGGFRQGSDNCRFWFIPVQPLLCNQAVISHCQPISLPSFLKQFVYLQLYKFWLTTLWRGHQLRSRTTRTLLLHTVLVPIQKGCGQNREGLKMTKRTESKGVPQQWPKGLENLPWKTKGIPSFQYGMGQSAQ